MTQKPPEQDLPDDTDMPLGAPPAGGKQPRRWQQTRKPVAHDRGHSTRVRFLRIALPALALSIIAAVFYWPVDAPQVKVVLPAELPKVTMEQPRFTGTDSAGQPFVITATRAQQLSGRMAVVDLDNLEAEISLKGGTDTRGRARIGRFDQEQRRLWLGGNVQLSDSRGHRFAAYELNIDIPTRTAWSEKPVRLSGDFGTVTGDGIKVFDGGKTVIFTGRSKAVLSGKQTKTETAE